VRKLRFLENWMKKLLSQLAPLKPKSAVLAFLVCTALLSGCAGMPILTAARMATLNTPDVLFGDATHFAVALNVDQQVHIPPDYRPTLEIDISPNVAGDYPPFKRSLSFEAISSTTAPFGLSNAKSGRQWVVLRFSRKSVTQHEELKSYIADVKKRPDPKGGGKMNTGLSLPPLGDFLPKGVDGYSEVWVRLSERDGFFEFWSGTLTTLPRKS
jgi:hypothetical protein